MSKLPTGLDRLPSGKVRARYRDRDGRQHSAIFDKVKAARDWRNAQLAAVANGTHVDAAGGKITFAEYAERWREIQVHRPTTRAHVETQLRRHALPTFGTRSLSSVRPSHVQAWVTGLPLQPSTVEVIYRYVSAVFKAAAADRLIPSSPCVGIRLPKIPRRQVAPLSTDAVQAITDAVPGRYRALVTLAAGTGLRQGECFGVEVRHIDFLRRQLRVEQQLVLLPGAPPQIAPPKTAASYRTVPLPQVVVDALAAHLAAFPAGASGLVFTSPEGFPIRRTRFSETVWRPAMKRAGLPMGTHFHDLRHYYASLLIRHGESVKVVQARLGHASAAETLDGYSHLWPDSEDRTRLAVDSVLGSRSSVTGVSHFAL